MDAWIEIGQARFFDRRCQSHPLWMRGLKYALQQTTEDQTPSHPLWMRGLKSLYPT